MFFSLKELVHKWLGDREKTGVPAPPPAKKARVVPPIPAPAEATAPPPLPSPVAAGVPSASPAAHRGDGLFDRHGIRQLRPEENLYALFTNALPQAEEAEEEAESFAELLPTHLGQDGLAALLVAKHGLPEQPRTRQAKLARYPPPQVELDLHGLTMDEAAPRIASFVQTAHAKGLKTIRLITGKGLHSAGRPVLPGVTERQLLALRERRVVWTYRWEGAGREGSGSVVVYLER